MTIKNYINDLNKKKNYYIDKDINVENKLKELLQNNKYDCNQLYLKKNIFREFLQLYDKKMFDRIFEIFGEQMINMEK